MNEAKHKDVLFAMSDYRQRTIIKVRWMSVRGSEALPDGY